MRNTLKVDSAQEKSPDESKTVSPTFYLYEYYFIFGKGETNDKTIYHVHTL